MSSYHKQLIKQLQSHVKSWPNLKLYQSWKNSNEFNDFAPCECSGIEEKLVEVKKTLRLFESSETGLALLKQIAKLDFPKSAEVKERPFSEIWTDVESRVENERDRSLLQSDRVTRDLKLQTLRRLEILFEEYDVSQFTPFTAIDPAFRQYNASPGAQEIVLNWMLRMGIHGWHSNHNFTTKDGKSHKLSEYWVFHAT